MVATDALEKIAALGIVNELRVLTSALRTI